jgi:hypothetical protein
MQFTAIVTAATEGKGHPDIKSLVLYNYLLTSLHKMIASDILEGLEGEQKGRDALTI